MLTLVYAVGIGLSMGTTAWWRVASAKKIQKKRGRCGAGDRSRAGGIDPVFNRGAFFAKDLLALMGADAWSIEHGYRFTVWMLGGNAVIMLIFVINAVFRGAGDAAIAMRVLWLSNGINIVLDPMLIFGGDRFPPWASRARRWRRTSGAGLGVTLQLWVLFRGAKHIRILTSRCV
jgi:Na+-driven multidrug efflux pump